MTLQGAVERVDVLVRALVYVSAVGIDPGLAVKVRHNFLSETASQQ